MLLDMVEELVFTGLGMTKHHSPYRLYLFEINIFINILITVCVQQFFLYTRQLIFALFISNLKDNKL